MIDWWGATIALCIAATAAGTVLCVKLWREDGPPGRHRARPPAPARGLIAPAVETAGPEFSERAAFTAGAEEDWTEWSLGVFGPQVDPPPGTRLLTTDEARKLAWRHQLAEFDAAMREITDDVLGGDHVVSAR